MAGFIPSSLVSDLRVVAASVSLSPSAGLDEMPAARSTDGAPRQLVPPCMAHERVPVACLGKPSARAISDDGVKLDDIVPTRLFEIPELSAAREGGGRAFSESVSGAGYRRPQGDKISRQLAARSPRKIGMELALAHHHRPDGPSAACAPKHGLLSAVPCQPIGQRCAGAVLGGHGQHVTRHAAP
ncbi:hypothetical protein MAPG_08290 [Magnaporthiopsis poae ATCC 64411]|uniref:Uncharacterized protein n=1 Tax=Magnaporthiopsis poae (strain ATCC 64411 / 73-15) TaxID=644358 RepID=A0A0C4E6Z0_MAGP6|nr:hypothetical protein MAPG_08290 [Magnaporthiopsis poae ATCC 64411]